MEENNIKAPVEEREQTAEELNELLQISFESRVTLVAWIETSTIRWI